MSTEQFGVTDHIEVAVADEVPDTADGNGADGGRSASTGTGVAEHRRGPIALATRRLLRNPLALVALGFLFAVIVVGVLAPLIAPYDPNEQLTGPPFLGPFSDGHLLGTDDLGRDIFSRILYGARLSILVSTATVAIALIIAVPIGLSAGYHGGRIEYGIMRVTDAMMSFPGLVLAISLVAVLGPSLKNTMIAIAVVLIPGFTRLVRGQALAIREESFIEASKSIGSPTKRIIFRRVFPNLLSPLVVQVSIALGIVLLAEASLSFLGLGARPPEISWGAMLRQASEVILVHPGQMYAPGLAIALTVLAFNTLGDGILDALTGGSGARGRRGRRRGLTFVERKMAPETSVAAPVDDAVSNLEPAPIERHESEAAPSPMTMVTLERNGEAARAAAELPPTDALLAVDGLTVQFSTARGWATVVDNVSFQIRKGETLGLVGESGSGKTVTSLSVMRLLPSPPSRITAGSVRFDGRDLLTLPIREMTKLRGSRIAMVFQDPMSSLNPALTIQHQIGQVVRWHDGGGKKHAATRANEVLEMVGIPKRRATSYPHELSGGQRQRAMIAMALVCRPSLLIADEPTTALDVTIQAQVLELMHELRKELEMAILFVTHDLGVVADICDRVAVMYAGQIVETAPVRELFHHPKHPYTEGLLRAMPQKAEPRSELYVIPGQVPQFHEFGTGCRLAPRCEYAQDRCRTTPIRLERVDPVHLARCIRWDELDLEAKI
ncbi:MAG: dipeptide/oligopeptide/nickel ABC transporter permease/ATP-binding protein [Ilumatobacteraceae bacterium]